MSFLNIDEHCFNESLYLEKSHDYFDNLSQTEKESLWEYVHEMHGEINSALYSETNIFEYSGIVDSIDKALMKSPDDTPQVLWRRIPEETRKTGIFTQSYVIDRIVDFPGYLSTAETLSAITEIKSLRQFYMSAVDCSEWVYDELGHIIIPTQFYQDSPRNFLMCFINSIAAPVSLLRGRVDEQEWLISRNSSFKVVESLTNHRIKGKVGSAESCFADVIFLEKVK